MFAVALNSNIEFHTSNSQLDIPLMDFLTRLQVKCLTWTKEASFLYDYIDNKQIEHEQFKITEPGKQLRSLNGRT